MFHRTPQARTFAKMVVVHKRACLRRVVKQAYLLANFAPRYADNCVDLDFSAAAK